MEITHENPEKDVFIVGLGFQVCTGLIHIMNANDIGKIRIHM